VLFEPDVGDDKFDVAAAVIVINLRLVCNVKEVVLENLLFQFSEPETDTADCGCIIGNRKLQMLAA